ncbi:MAG TPA: aminoglycoside phosphotransferase family protein [Iamia sp.]|nr:aminoglycoside phosphotransferase family protein [Iamia sp.]
MDLDRLADDVAGFLAASSGPRPGGVGPRDLTGSCDLALAWTLFDGSRRARFRTAVGADDATWARARGWALWKAVKGLAEHPEGHPRNDGTRLGWAWPATGGAEWEAGAVGAVRWSEDGSVEALRGALGVAAPALAGEPITLGPRPDGSPPRYWRGTARVGAGWVAKVAWSAEAAARLDHERTMLARLRDLAPAVPLPEVVVSSADPLLLVTRYVPGVPLAGPLVATAPLTAVPVQLAAVLAALHDPAVRDGLADVALGDPEPQSGTEDLRRRVAGPIVTAERARRVRAWCDWVDAVLAGPAPEPVVLHGDLHGHNLVVSEDGGDLRLVVDLEEAALGDPHYDLRYLVSIRADLAWFAACGRAYERATGRRLEVERIVAWHVRTALGDVMWRTERGVALPGGMTPDGIVDDIAGRMAALGVGP